MRKYFLPVLLSFWLVMPALFASFPLKSPNPWKDDYRDISGMENYKSWGTYNVHDPAILRDGDTYYMFSTDAIFFQRRNGGSRPEVKTGNIQVRTSKDLIHWQFEGWAFDSIPTEAGEWVLSHSDNKGATNIWAPFPVKYQDKFRLYYCVSAFGLQTSYIGLAESKSPLGPWEMKGAVIKTKRGDRMNAIDPTVISDPETAKMWMHYGSYFGGLFAVELNPETGFTKIADDQGKKIAGRANYRRDNIEAPEIMYNPRLKKYFLFVSYDPLMTTYNIRVGRSENIDGPFYDYNGLLMSDTTNNYPILTYPYQFKNHAGWAGTGHNGIIADKKGNFYTIHQGRLSPDNHLMVMHVREIKWTKSGWPVFSPERFADLSTTQFNKNDIPGTWEIIRISDSHTDRALEYGQILWGENQLRKTEVNTSSAVDLLSKGKLKNADVSGKWKYSDKDGLSLMLKKEKISNLIVFVGHDWENETETLLFTGLDGTGRSVWGKKTTPRPSP